MAYTPTTWTTGDTITASAMNKIENGIADGGGYDLVITYDFTVNPSTCTVTSGDILDCEDKLDNHEVVNAVCVLKGSWSWAPSTANTRNEDTYLPLNTFTGPYTRMNFSKVTCGSDSTAAFIVAVDVYYDKDTGAITNFAYWRKSFTVTGTGD